MTLKEWGSAVKLVADVFTVIGVLAGVGYFAFRIFYQKWFQRLTAEVTARLVKKTDTMSLLEIECEIVNEGEARINFDAISLELPTPSEPSFNLPTRPTPFSENLIVGTVREPATPSSQPGPSHSTTKCYSVDAKSTVRLRHLISLPSHQDVITVRATFIPTNSGDKYIVERTVNLNDDAGAKSTKAPELGQTEPPREPPPPSQNPPEPPSPPPQQQAASEVKTIT